MTDDVAFRFLADGDMGARGDDVPLQSAYVFTEQLSWERFCTGLRGSGGSAEVAPVAVDWNEELVVVAALDRPHVHLLRCEQVVREPSFVEVRMRDVPPAAGILLPQKASRPWCAVAVAAPADRQRLYVRFLPPHA